MSTVLVLLVLLCLWPVGLGQQGQQAHDQAIDRLIGQDMVLRLTEGVQRQS